MNQIQFIHQTIIIIIVFLCYFFAHGDHTDYAMDTKVTNGAVSHERIKIRSILEATHGGVFASGGVASRCGLR
jgi:hypothetical protein